MALPSSGWAESQLPTAKTVTWAPWSPRIWSARRVRAGSPAPWKVSATAGTEDGPCRTSAPGVRSSTGTACGCPVLADGADASDPAGEEGADVCPDPGGRPPPAVTEGAAPLTSGLIVEQATTPRPTAARPPPTSARRPTTGSSSGTRTSSPDLLEFVWDPAVARLRRTPTSGGARHWSEDRVDDVPAGADQDAWAPAARGDARVEPEPPGGVAGQHVGHAVTVEVAGAHDRGHGVPSTAGLDAGAQGAGARAGHEPEDAGGRLARQQVRSPVAIEVTGTEEDVVAVPAG